MKFKILFFILIFCGQTFATDSNSESVIESPTLICKNSNEVITISVKSAGDERIWISKEGSATGTELDVKSFSHLRCDFCYEISATSEFVGQVVQIKLNTLGKKSNVSMHASFSQYNESLRSEAYKCQKARSN